MPSEPELAPIVDRRAPRLSRMRRRLALAAGFGAGAATVVGLVHALVLLHAPPPRPPPAPAAVAAVPMPPPLVVTIEKTIEAPRQAVLDDDLGCPAVTAPDLPIGTPVDPRTIEIDPESSLEVSAAPAAPQLAVAHHGAAWVSDDEGRSFRRAFEDHSIDHVAVDRDGVIYAQSGEDLGVRTPGGKIRWRKIAVAECAATDAPCRYRIGLIGVELVGFSDSNIGTSTDQGRTWKRIENPDYAWSDRNDDGAVFAWNGSLYQTQHYTDMCGIDDRYTFRLDKNHRVEHDIFHDYFTDSNEPVLRASSDVTPTWTWAETCWNEAETVGRCTTKSATRNDLLRAAMLTPAEGARTLAVYQGSAIELCPRGVRQIYRVFPMDTIDAVDMAGRALVGKGMTLLRWSPVHGWRKLKTFVDPIKPDAGSD